MPALLQAFYERLGLNAFVQGDYEKAERWFRKLEHLEPDSIRVLRNLGVILIARGDSAGAERYLLEEERLYGQSYQRHRTLADLAYAVGRRDEAARRYRAALADHEAAPGASIAGSRRLLQTRLEICTDDERYTKSRQSASRFADAEGCRMNGEPSRAAALFEEAGDLDPTNWPALNNAGTIHLNELGQASKAAILFERAVSMDGSPRIAHNLGLAVEAVRKESSR